MFKKIYIKIDDKREKVEDFIADNILKRWTTSKKKSRKQTSKS